MIRTYRYTAVICFQGGIWKAHQGDFSRTLGKWNGTSPGIVSASCKKHLTDTFPTAEHVFVLKTRLIKSEGDPS